MFSCFSGKNHEDKTKSFPKNLNEDYKQDKLPEPYLSLSRRVDSVFREFIALGFNGNILVAQGPLVFYKNSHGIADKVSRTSLTDSSVFQLASVSKTITATAILLLAQEGKLSLTEDIRRYLPEFPYEGITLDMLLCHRSGLPNYLYFCYQYEPNDSTIFTNRSVYEMICSKQPDTYLKPNRRFNYCNTNYALLPLVVEQISGENFFDFVRKRIFLRAGMRNTWFADELKGIVDPKLITKGYTASFNPVAEDRFDGVCGDKGLYSTTADMFKFLRAYFKGRLITPAWVALATNPHSKEKVLSNYGYGWRMKNFKDSTKIVYHNGWWHGYRTALQYRVRDSISIVILGNTLNNCAYSTWKIFRAIDGVPYTGIDNTNSEEE